MNFLELSVPAKRITSATEAPTALMRPLRDEIG